MAAVLSRQSFYLSESMPHCNHNNRNVTLNLLLSQTRVVAHMYYAQEVLTFM